MNSSVAPIESYLQNSLGLDPDATPGIVGRIVTRILIERKINDSFEYLQLLKRSKNEFDYFLDQVLVPETWFFRYPEAYNYLRRFAQTRVSSAYNRLKILSVPCSTGEEPYSIAMNLIDAGLTSNQFLIDAADVSATALQKARSAVYTENSFRGSDQSYKNRFFEKTGRQFQLKQNIRRLVNFILWNVQQTAPREIKLRYDIIFCRNLFIYFHPAAQKKMISTLNKHLEDEGLLFAGHAEAGPLLSPAFRTIPPLKAFVHCKR